MKRFIPIIILASFVYGNCQYPYNGRIICKQFRGDCSSYELPNGVLIKANHCDFLRVKGKLSFGIFCSLQNSSDGSVSFNRRNFQANSTKGLTFEALPFEVMNKKNKIVTEPDFMTLAKGTFPDYIFTFSTTNHYSNEEMIKLLRADTINFIYTVPGKTDTLFQAVVDDNRTK